MFPFFPFITDGQTSSVGRQSTQTTALPLLPVSRAYRSAGGDVTPDIATIGVDFIRQALAALTSSLTALGSRTNALFAQVAAGLALDRAARATAAAFGDSMPPAPIFPFTPQTPFLNPWQGDPWAAFAQGLEFWMKLWVPAAAQRSPYSSITASPAQVAALPWGSVWGQQRYI